MRNVAMTEWVIARFAGERQAATIMGDLLEQREQKGAWWFWRSVAEILLAVAWRPVLGFVGALYVFAYAYNGTMTREFGLWVTPGLEVATFLGVIAWFVAVYAGVRYGVRDRLTQLSALTAVLGSAAACLWRSPVIVGVCAALGFAIVVVSATVRSWRRAALVFLGTGVTFFAGYNLMALTDLAYTRYVLHLRLIGTPQLEQHPSIGYVDLVMQLLGEFVTAWVCAKMHRRFVERVGVEFTSAN